MTDDERMTWGFIIEVLDVLERHGYLRSDNQHTGQAIGLLADLAHLYEGTKDAHLSAYTIQVPELSQTTAAQPGPAADQDAVVVSAAEVKTIVAALDVAADYKRDRAETCAECTGQSCLTCQSRLQDAQAYDHMAAQMLQAAEASRAATASYPEPDSQPHPAADMEAGQ
jgi:hypothetical protein